MIDLDALKAELEASGLDPSGSWREWLVVGNITVYRRGAVYMSPGDEINQQDFRALAIIARHVAPVVTPDQLYRKCPSCEGTRTVWDDPESDHPEEYPCSACTDGYVPVVTPEPDAEARDVLVSGIARGLEDWACASWGEITQLQSEFIADAGMAALRGKGFAVVRTADVEAALDLALGGEEHTPETDRLKEAIR